MMTWSRLIGGTGSSPTKTRPTNTPAERLEAVKRSCNALQELWRTSAPLSSNKAAANYCRNCVQRLNNLLDEESKKSAPHSGLLYAASTQIYIIVTKLALSSQDSGVINASARFFHFLVDGEVEGVLDSKLFARSLVDLVKRTIGAQIITINEEEEGDLVELLFGVATKIKLDPSILPAWFYPAHVEGKSHQAGTERSEFAGVTRRADFPLFYLLIDYVYHDGRTGDFARTGLLYLTDTAAKSTELETWMIESDLATLMASGLGALYSRLSRRLPSMANKGQLPPILALSDYTSDTHRPTASAESFRKDMDAFLSYLLFWQDTLNHCQSTEVNDTLLDHFHVLFLQQLLYPSLLESSDVDGGSTASFITYLYQILESLDHPELVRRILEYLLAAKDKAMTRHRSRKQRMSLSRRKSLDALTALAQAKDGPSPDLFNLVDLIMMSLKSKHAPTVTASLKLVSVIQQRHHRFALTSFIHTHAETSEPKWPKLSDLNAQLQHLISLAPVVLDDGLIDQSYSEILKDVLDSLELHRCSAYIGPEEDSEKRMIITEDDVLLAAVKDLLSSFFANDTMANIALTEAIICIASCRLTRLEGWLLPESDQSTTSTITSILERLIDQVRLWRSQVAEWDHLIVLQKCNLDDRVIEDTRIKPILGSSHQSLDSSRPFSVPRSSNRSIEVPKQMKEKYTQSMSQRGRLPRTLHSEGFGSINGSLASSPSPSNPLLHHRSKVGSPLRETSLLATSGPSSPTTSSRASSNSPRIDTSPNAPEPDRDQLRHRMLTVSPLPFASGAPSAKPASPPFKKLMVRQRGAGRDRPNDEQDVGVDDEEDQEDDDDDAASLTSEQSSSLTTATATTTVTLSHVLVNAIILQEFILEIAALVQVRACEWGEIEL